MIKKISVILLAIVLLATILPFGNIVLGDILWVKEFEYDSKLEDKEAFQGVCSDGTYLYAVDNHNIRKYNKSGTLQTATTDASLEGTDMAQINSIYYHATDDRLYVGSNNYPHPDHLGYIKVFEASDLSYVEEHQVKNYWCEGCAFYDDAWWVTYHNWKYVSKYNTSWVWQADYALSFSSTHGYQGLVWIGDYLFANLHEGDPTNYCDVYKWNGSGFDEVVRLDRPTEDCTQGMGKEPGDSIMWWAERDLVESEGNIVKSYINGLPEVTTFNCTDETSTSFQANGEITNDGSATITTRGFYYTTVFDDFEWGEDEDPLSNSEGAIDWTDGSGGSSGAEIDTAYHYAGTRSVRLYRDGSENTWVYFTHAPISSDQVIGFWIRKNDTANFGLYHGDGSTLINMFVGTDEEIKYYSDSTHGTGVYIDVDTWEHITIQNADWDADTYDIYLNDILVKADTPMRTNAGWDSQVKFYSTVGSDDIWLDNVGVWDVEDESGPFGEGEYDLEISGLDPATTYYVRAFAKNEAGIGYGAVVMGVTSSVPVGYSWGVIIG